MGELEFVENGADVVDDDKTEIVLDPDEVEIPEDTEDDDDD